MGSREGTVLETLAWQQSGDTLILCAAGAAATDADFDQWIERLGQLDFKRLLVYARGRGGLSSRQRARVGEFWRQAPAPVPPTALLTDSQLARYAMTAICWLVGGETRAYDLQDWTGALAWLGVEGERGAIKNATLELYEQLRQKQRQSA